MSRYTDALMRYMDDSVRAARYGQDSTAPLVSVFFSGGHGAAIGLRRAGFNVLFVGDADYAAARSATDTHHVSARMVLGNAAPSWPSRLWFPDQTRALAGHHPILTVLCPSTPGELHQGVHMAATLDSNYVAVVTQVTRRVRTIPNLSNATVSAYTVAATDCGLPYAMSFDVRIYTLRGGPPVSLDLPPCTRHLLRDAISDLDAPDMYDTLANHTPAPLGRLVQRRVDVIPPGGDWTALDRHPDLRASWIPAANRLDAYGRLAWGDTLGRLSDRFQDPLYGRWIHPAKPRMLTHREVARVLGFPDDYVFKGDPTDVTRQLVAAIPPPVAYAVGASVLRHAYGDDLEDDLDVDLEY